MYNNSDADIITDALRVARQTQKPIALRPCSGQYNRKLSFVASRNMDEQHNDDSDVWGIVHPSGYLELTCMNEKKKTQKEILSYPIPFAVGREKALMFTGKMRDEINKLVIDLRKDGNDISYIGDFLIDGFCIAEWLCSGQVSRVDKALWSISDCGSHLFHSREFKENDKNTWRRMVEPYVTSRIFVIDFDKGTLSQMSFEECYKVMVEASRAKR